MTVLLGGPGKRCVVLMNQSSRDHTLLDVRPSPGPGRGAVSSQSSRDKRHKRSLPGSTVRREGRAISAADLIVIADTVHTLDAPTRPVQAVAVADGLIVALGERRDVAGWTGPRTRVVDLGPGVLTPGLVDGHIHPVFGIDLTTGVDLSPAGNLDQLRAIVRAAAERLGPDDWFQGYGLDPNAFGDAPVTAGPLTEVLGGRPALAMMFDAHSALATPAALARAGITGPRELRRRRQHRLRRRRGADRAPAGDPRLPAGA